MFEQLLSRTVAEVGFGECCGYNFHRSIRANVAPDVARAFDVLTSAAAEDQDAKRRMLRNFLQQDSETKWEPNEACGKLCEERTHPDIHAGRPPERGGEGMRFVPASFLCTEIAVRSETLNVLEIHHDPPAG